MSTLRETIEPSGRSKDLQLQGLDRAVLECVVYSDVFDFPVTAEEVWRSLPVQASLPEVDAQRIGAMGHSLGGHGAIFLAAYDERVKAAAGNCSAATGICSDAAKFSARSCRSPVSTSTSTPSARHASIAPS